MVAAADVIWGSREPGQLMFTCASTVGMFAMLASLTADDNASLATRAYCLKKLLGCVRHGIEGFAAPGPPLCQFVRSPHHAFAMVPSSIRRCRYVITFADIVT